LKQHTFIIAEIGVNHCGSVAQAQKLIDVASDAGADAVKFQTFDVESLVTSDARVAQYQRRQSSLYQRQVDLLRGLALTPEDHVLLKEYSNFRGIEFMSTAFDLVSLELLTKTIGVNTLKIASGEITNGPLIYEHGRTGLNTFVSTGMADLEEIYNALIVLEAGLLGRVPPTKSLVLPKGNLLFENSILRGKVTILQCTSQYPTEKEYVNLRVLNGLKQKFGLPVGFSDHSLGNVAAIGAVAIGATVVEKHITLDRGLEGPDHKASSDPVEFARLVREVRELEECLGTEQKKRELPEADTAEVARKSLVASQPVLAGEKFSIRNLTVKRPGTGISPMEYWALLDQCSKKNYRKDEEI